MTPRSILIASVMLASAPALADPDPFPNTLSSYGGHLDCTARAALGQAEIKKFNQAEAIVNATSETDNDHMLDNLWTLQLAAQDAVDNFRAYVAAGCPTVGPDQLAAIEAQNTQLLTGIMARVNKYQAIFNKK
jgi:hypothetical protein